MPIKLRRTNPNTGINEWRKLASLKLRRTNPNTLQNEWRNINSAYLKVGSAWKLIFGKSGPFTTTAPYFSTDQNGNTEITTQTIVYGSTIYGQKGVWNSNGGTESSYNYKIETSTSVIPGSSPYTTIVDFASLSTDYKQIVLNSSDYDGKYLIFTVKQTRTDGVFGTSSTDDRDLAYRQKVIKKKPTLGPTNTTLWINGSPGITLKPKAGDALSLIATWDSTENQSIDSTRTITRWYRSSTFPTLNTTSPKAASGGYYETTGATLISDGTSAFYAVTSADNNSYIFANQEVFNSFTDYNYGTAEGNGIKTGAAFTQTVGAPYSFAMGNILYPSTNGSVGLDSGYGGTSLPTSGRHLFIYGLDLVSISTKHWSNNSDYIIQYTGGQVFNPNVPEFQITYQVKFSTDHPTYVLVRIINKGSNVPQPTYIGYYEGSTQISTVAGPYVLGTGSTYRINFDGTAGTTSGITFAGVNNAAFITDFGAGNDNTFYTLTTATQEFTKPTIAFNAPTIGSTSLSYTVASTGSDFSFYDYAVKTTSYNGTIVKSGINQTGTLSITGLVSGTTYYIEVYPYNSQTQGGTTVQFTATTSNPPGVPTNLTRTTGNAGAKTFSWDAPTTGGAVTSYEYQLNSLGWINNGTTRTIALTGLSGSNTFQVRAIGSQGTGTAATTGSFTIPIINSGPTAGSITSTGATISWTSTNQSTYSLSIPNATGTPFTGTTGTSRSVSLSASTTYTPTLTITSTTSDTATTTGANFTTSAPPAVAPSNTVAPAVTPTSGTLGSTQFTCTTGSWSGTATITYAYSWQYLTSGGYQSAGVTTSTYTPPTSLANISGFLYTIRCVVTATNTAGSTAAGSNSVSVSAPATTTTTTAAPSYTLTVNCNSGTGCPSSGTHAGSYTIPASNPTRSGFTFAGYDATCSGSFIGRYSAGQTVLCTGTIVLTAAWTAIATTTTTTTTAGALGTRCTSSDVSFGCCVNGPVGTCTSGFGSGASCSPIVDFAPGSGC
jgi:hypothetical protein